MLQKLDQARVTIPGFTRRAWGKRR